jgi:hypothetical protein
MDLPSKPPDGHNNRPRRASAPSNWVEQSSRPKSWSAISATLRGGRKMSIQDNTGGTRETAARAGTGRGRERSPNANAPSPSSDDELAEAWLDANRQTVEANTFFAFTIEPEESAKIAPGGQERTWVPPTPDRLDSTRAMRA